MKRFYIVILNRNTGEAEKRFIAEFVNQEEFELEKSLEFFLSQNYKVTASKLD